MMNFQHPATAYRDRSIFTRNTAAEVDFVRKLYEIDRLDIDTKEMPSSTITGSKFEGALIIPGMGEKFYADWMTFIMDRTGRFLMDIGWRFCNELIGNPEQTVQLIGPSLPRAETQTILYQLGGEYRDLCALHAGPVMKAHEQTPLDPGAVLVIVATMARFKMITAPMRIVCAGAWHDPELKGNFDDVIRIDVQSPMNNALGAVVVESNSGKHTRVLQGFGTGRALDQ